MPALRQERLVGYRLAEISLPEEIKPPMPEARVCEFDGCETVLSRYNRDSFCSLHYSPNIKKKAEKKVLVACIICGTERYIKYESANKFQKAKEKPCRSCARKLR